MISFSIQLHKLDSLVQAWQLSMFFSARQVEALFFHISHFSSPNVSQFFSSGFLAPHISHIFSSPSFPPQPPLELSLLPSSGLSAWEVFWEENIIRLIKLHLFFRPNVLSQFGPLSEQVKKQQTWVHRWGGKPCASLLLQKASAHLPRESDSPSKTKLISEISQKECKTFSRRRRHTSASSLPVAWQV